MGRSADLQNNYAAGPRTYSLVYIRDQQSTAQERQSFAPGEITNDTSFSTTYFKPRTGEERESFMRGHLGTNAEYVAAGIWETVSAPRNVGQDSVTTQALRVFVFGSPTVASEVPKTGTISYSYRGLGYAFASDAYRGFQINSVGTGEPFTINFVTGQFTGIVDVCSANIVTCAPLRLTGNLAAASGRVQGTIADADNRFTGTFEGATFGPGSRELGLAFVLQNADGRRMVATLVGRSTQ